MSDDLLNTILDTIAAERPRFRRSFELAEDVLTQYGEISLAEQLYDAIPTSRAWEDVADLFAILSWRTSDDGSALHRTAERWLREGTDLRRVQIALHLDVYPFLNSREMEMVLSELAARMPDAAPRCLELIRSRRQASRE